MSKMPLVFVGHGSPMNAVEDNHFVRDWQAVAGQIPTPKAILCISAHWYTDATYITADERPAMIYDMYGFPSELYEIQYPAVNDLSLVTEIESLLAGRAVKMPGRGYDHGVWSVLCHMYPQADIPLCQLSIDASLPIAEHYKIGKSLAALREQGVLILGSGNVVHNLGRVGWDMSGGYPWAEEFDAYIKEHIVKRDDDAVIHFEKAGASARQAVPYPDHFIPLLYILGASGEEDQVSTFADGCVLGSLSMTSYIFS
ncbi:MAG: 4,5-DOPA dioxygenase extradiol [Lachnospiraceae bacterium]